MCKCWSLKRINISFRHKHRLISTLLSSILKQQNYMYLVFSCPVITIGTSIIYTHNHHIIDLQICAWEIFRIVWKISAVVVAFFVTSMTVHKKISSFFYFLFFFYLKWNGCRWKCKMKLNRCLEMGKSSLKSPPRTEWTDEIMKTTRLFSHKLINKCPNNK